MSGGAVQKRGGACLEASDPGKGCGSVWNGSRGRVGGSTERLKLVSFANGARLRGVVSAACCLLALAAFAVTATAAPKFRTVDDALDQGLSSFNGGYYEMAEPALQFVVKNGNEDTSFLGRYYLARIYADNNGARTDHARAYELYQRIADDYADIDPEDDRRGPFVAKSLIALAGYLRRGLPDIGRSANPHRAAEYLRHAATIFGDEDAQFELAKMQLKGEGVEAEPAQAKHWLSVLSQKGHVGAQAFLADLYWRGKLMEADPVRALALITIAAANAPPGERVWIEDIYQNIYCGAGEGIRKQATGLVADWRTRYSRRPAERTRDGLGSLGSDATRTCKDGSPVAPTTNGNYESWASRPQPGTSATAAAAVVAPAGPAASLLPSPSLPTPSLSVPSFTHGAAGSLGGQVGAGFAPGR